MKHLLLLFLLVIALSPEASPQFSGGASTAAAPYQIASRADMEALADSVNNGDHWSKDKHFEITQDITDSVRTIIGFSWGIFGMPEGKE